MQNLKKNRFVVSKNDKNMVSSYHSKVSKICILIGPFRAKYITFDLKKYREVIFHDTEESCKFGEKLTCGLENDRRNLEKLTCGLEIDRRNLENFHQSTGSLYLK